MSGRYDASSLIVRSSYEIREKLGVEFWKLINFVLDWAVILYDIRRAENTKKKINIGKLLRQASYKFNRDKYSGEPIRWGEDSIKNGMLWMCEYHTRIIYDREAIVDYYAPRIDVELIRYTFRNIFHPDQAIEQNERYQFQNFWERILVTCLTRTKYYDENGNSLDIKDLEAELPGDYDSWVFENISIVISQMQKKMRMQNNFGILS